MSSKKHRDNIWIKNLRDGRIPENQWLSSNAKDITPSANLCYIPILENLGPKRTHACITYIIGELERMNFKHSQAKSSYSRHSSIMLGLYSRHSSIMLGLEDMIYYVTESPMHSPMKHPDFWSISIINLSSLRRANVKARSHSIKLGLI